MSRAKKVNRKYGKNTHLTMSNILVIGVASVEQTGEVNYNVEYLCCGTVATLNNVQIYDRERKAARLGSKPNSCKYCGRGGNTEKRVRQPFNSRDVSITSQREQLCELLVTGFTREGVRKLLTLEMEGRRHEQNLAVS